MTIDRAVLPESSFELAGDHPRLRDTLVTRINQLARHERPAAVILLQRPFTVDGGELTPNLKLRRMEIERKYKSAIDRLYAKLDTMSSEPAIDQFLIQLHE